jgi:DnaJ-class molecular chaperone
MECPKCLGKGKVANSVVCPTCNGKGWIFPK